MNQDLKQSLEFAERLAATLRDAIEAGPMVAQLERTKSQVENLRVQKDKLVESVKSLELRIVERQKVVDEYEGKFGRITRLQDLDRMIATAEQRLKAANKQWTAFQKAHGLDAAHVTDDTPA